MKQGQSLTLSRVPGAIRGIALTTPEKMGDLKDAEWSCGARKVRSSLDSSLGLLP